MSDKKDKKELEVSQKRAATTAGNEPIREGSWFVPEVDINEDDEGINLFADLPGVSEDGLDVQVQEGVLTLTASVNPVESRRRLIYQEYEIGGFQRRFNLGERIDAGKISAKLTNGVLKLTLPKAEAHKPRKIAVKA